MIAKEDLPELRDLLSATHHDVWDEDYIDPEELLESAIVEQDIDLDRAVGELRRVFEANPDEASLAAQFRTLGIQLVPFRLTYREFFERVLARLESGEPLWHDLYDRPIHSVAPLPRASRWHDQSTAEDAATKVLRGNAGALHAFAAGDGRARLHLYRHLKRNLGRVESRTSKPAKATAAVVVLGRAPETGQPFVLGTYPEVRLDESWRRRYPELPHLLGAYFGQDWHVDETVYNAECLWHELTAIDVRRTIAEQLSALLTEVRDDDELRTAVDALGCYVQPDRLRQWLERVHERVVRGIDRAHWSWFSAPG
jgi:hypothetical protein